MTFDHILQLKVTTNTPSDSCTLCSVASLSSLLASVSDSVFVKERGEKRQKEKVLVCSHSCHVPLALLWRIDVVIKTWDATHKQFVVEGKLWLITSGNLFLYFCHHFLLWWYQQGKADFQYHAVLTVCLKCKTKLETLNPPREFKLLHYFFL